MHEFIDLTRYPLDRPDSAAFVELVRSARDELDRTGMFNLPGFLKPKAIARAVTEVTPVLATASFRHARSHNIYFRKSIPGLGADHPALRSFDTVNHTICTDQLAGMVMRQLYEWPAFAAFLAVTMEKPALYTMDDPISGVNVMAYHAGEALNWHFDRSEFTTTLLLQAPQSGGAFEYRTALRTDYDPNYDGVARLLAGQDPDARLLQVAPGTLNVFRGKNTAHRVTPVVGSVPRVISVFSYYDRPGVSFSDEERVGFYGRTG